MRVSSIRQRLLCRLVPVVAICCFLAAGLVYFGTRAELRDALNAQSDILALTIAGLEGKTISRASFGEGLERYGQDYLIRVWDADGTLLVDSNADLHGLLDTAALEPAPSTLDEGWDVREYILGSGERVLIARLEQEAEELVLQVAFTSLVPMALALLGAILTATVLVRQGLTPLTSLSRELTQRSASDLRQLPASDAPDELEPIIEEMNALLARIETSLKRERRFVDDAAHELRTPLSIIKAQCQAIDLNTLDAGTRTRLENITQGVDRMAALSSQLLDQTRAEQTEHPAKDIYISLLVSEVCATLAPEAEKRGVTIKVIKKANPVHVGSAEDLRTIFQNILENALKFAGSPGRVHITLSETCVMIEDNGPGVPAVLRDQIFDRFFQMNKTGGGGAGLGLSIVNAIAERTGITVTVHDSEVLKGACFRTAWATPA
jgi:signal transduction histidine kinase